MLPNSFYKTRITLIPKPNRNIYIKKQLQAIITDEHTCKNPQQNFSEQNSATHHKAIYHDQVGFIPGMQGFFKIHKSIKMIHHIK